MKRSFLFLAPGFEEIEALSVVDIMRRAGLDVKSVAVNDSTTVVGAHGITVTADMLFGDEDMSDASWLIIPGGMPGAANLAANEGLCTLLRSHAAKGGNIAAICAAPAVVLAPLGLLEGSEATCYPGFEDDCKSNGATMRDTPVMNCGRLITANGPAAAMRFALAIVANELGESVAQQIGGALLFYPRQVNLYL